MNFSCDAKGFWDFYAMRQEAYWWRQAGNPSRTFRDRQLATGWYPNVVREQDTGTKAYHAGLTQPTTMANALWRSATYRPINKLKTFQDFGWPMPNDIKTFIEKVCHARRWGYVPFTGRHQVSGMDRYISLCDYLSENLINFAYSLGGLPPEGTFSTLSTLPGFAQFFSWQVMCDLMEAKVTAFDEDEWVKLGPGAARGLSLAYGGKAIPKAKLVDYAKSLRDKQSLMLPHDFKLDCGLTHVTLKNVEHCACEFSRYIYQSWKA